MITNPFTGQVINLKKGTKSLIKGFKQMNNRLRDAAEARHHRKAGLEPWKLPEMRQKKAKAIHKERAQPSKTIAKKYKA